MVADFVRLLRRDLRPILGIVVLGLAATLLVAFTIDSENRLGQLAWAVVLVLIARGLQLAVLAQSNGIWLVLYFSVLSGGLLWTSHVLNAMSEPPASWIYGWGSAVSLELGGALVLALVLDVVVHRLRDAPEEPPSLRFWRIIAAVGLVGLALSMVISSGAAGGLWLGSLALELAAAAFLVSLVTGTLDRVGRRLSIVGSDLLEFQESFLMTDRDMSRLLGLTQDDPDYETIVHLQPEEPPDALIQRARDLAKLRSNLSSPWFCQPEQLRDWILQPNPELEDTAPLSAIAKGELPAVLDLSSAS